MFSSTLVVRTTTLISIFLRWMAPIGNMVIDSRVLALDNMTDLFRQIMTRIGTPLNIQSMEFLWRSGTQALWLLETQLFPEQCPQTMTQLATPSGQGHGFRFLTQDATFAAYVMDLQPVRNTLLEISDYLHQDASLEVPPEILQAIWDCTLVLENIALVFGIDFMAPQHQPRATPDRAAVCVCVCMRVYACVCVYM